MLKYFVLFFLSCSCAYGQGVRGHVYVDKQQPLPFTTIYIQQLETGTTTNQDGFYEIQLEPGQYDLVFQYLGYQTTVRSLTIADDWQTLDITLAEQIVQLRGVEVTAGKEDPAYTIIRKAIAKSKFHRLQVQHYTARVYVKGAGRVKDVPFLLERRMKKEGIDSSTVFLSESVSEITFDQPNTVKEKVISVRTIGEGNDTSPTPFINGSFYKPKVAGAISPLAPRAFAYYKFRYEGSFEDRGRTVNKIRVVPRSRGDNVFNGYIYILDDYWSIHSLQLFTYKQGFKISVNQIYSPVADNAWLPVSHRIEADGKVLGFDLEYKYLATVSDYAVELNTDLPNEFEVIDERIDQDLAELLVQEEKTKDVPDTTAFQPRRYTRRQLRRKLREYEKEIEKQTEAPEVVSNYSITVDSLASRKDSAYWAAVRPVPLNKRERSSYQKLDSMAVAEAREQKEREEGKRRNAVGSLLLGTTVDVGSKSTFRYVSPLGELRFNPVEGVYFNLPLVFRTSLDSVRTLAITATPRYSFARDKVIGKGEITLTYPATVGQGRVSLEGGRFVSQFDNRPAISPLLNSLVALLQKRNYVKLYEKDYIRLSAEQPMGLRWSARASLEYAERKPLFNQSDYALRRRESREYEPNAPDNVEQTTEFMPHQAAWGTVSVAYQPWLKYYVRNGNRRPINESSPLFRLTYRGGFPGVFKSGVDYHLLEAGVEQRLRIGARGVLNYHVFAGSFLGASPAYFMDFRHFPGSRVVVQESDPMASFRLLDYYRYSTSERYAVAHLHYQFRKLLLSRIFEVQLLGIKENLLVNHLKTPSSPHYTEVGYSIDNILRFLRVEAVANFHDGTYQGMGFRIGISTGIGNVIDF